MPGAACTETENSNAFAGVEIIVVTIESSTKRVLLTLHLAKKHETRPAPNDLSSRQPTPLLEKTPEAPKPPTIVPSINDIIQTRVPGYAARPERLNGPAFHPPSSFTGFVEERS